MLRLERMDISGFKSFGDRTKVVFPDGITAVVGPNGCGKSNIGDALNWVLGEQSAKMLRGQNMSDIIFAGTQGRKPLGMAEVSLHLKGLNGDRDKGAVITRRVFRDGDSDYLLNDKKCRLKDIQQVLRDARVGAKTYATIEQGRIDQILNAKPKDRRQLIEDAAGIAGFKHKRRLAELKLEATNANLLRVNDIIREVQRQINSLKRQAAKARRYQRMREELRGKQRARFGIRAQGLDGELRRLRQIESEAKASEAELATRLASHEAAVVTDRSALDDADRSFRELTQKLHQLEIAIDREESEIRRCKERIAEADEASARHDKQAEELAERRGALAEQVKSQHEALARDEEEMSGGEARLESRHTEATAVEERLKQARDRVEALRKELFTATQHAADERNKRRGLQEAAERNRAQHQRIVEERSGAQDESQRLNAESTRLEEEAARFARDVEQLDRACKESEQGLGEARKRHGERVESLSASREQEKSAAARLLTLEDVSTRFAGESDGVRALLSRGAEQGIRTRGVLADFVEASQEIEGAAEAYLQRLLPAVVLEDDGDAGRALDLLRSEGAGRTTLLCASQPAGCVAVGSAANGSLEHEQALLSDSRVLGRLRDRLTFKSQANGFVMDRIGDALLVEDLPAALALHREYPKVDFITQGGEVLYASGLISAGGKQNGDQGLLAHKRRTNEARGEFESAAARAVTLAEQVRQGRDEVERLEVELNGRRAALEEARRRSVEVGLRAERSTEDRDRSMRRSEVLAQEQETLEKESVRLGQELAACEREVSQSESRHQELEATLRDAVAEHDRTDQELRGVREQAAAAMAELAAVRQRLQGTRRETERLDELLAELDGRIEGAQNEAESARGRGRESRELQQQNEANHVRHLEERERSHKESLELQRVIEERRRDLEEKEKGLGSVKGELEKQRATARDAEMERATLEADRRHLDDLSREELGMSAGEAVHALAAELRAAEEEDGGAAPREISDDEIRAAAAGETASSAEGEDAEACPLAEFDLPDLDLLEEEIGGIKEKLEKMGPVNMMAIEEFSELDERNTFLTGQREDLETSINSLRESIRKINRQSRERFLEAFEAIRKNYQEIFSLLFNGGRADLRLEEGEDVLEGGIEILCQPPGKKLAGVHQMSGGEKAMSAISLLFAIFRYQPSPFCLLDEVDAALDDLNVGRFTRMLREYAAQTQFILVTHNKLAMESADLMYGVTMEEAGVSKLVSLQLN